MDNHTNMNNILGANASANRHNNQLHIPLDVDDKNHRSKFPTKEHKQGHIAFLLQCNNSDNLAHSSDNQRSANQRFENQGFEKS